MKIINLYEIPLKQSLFQLTLSKGAEILNTETRENRLYFNALEDSKPLKKEVKFFIIVDVKEQIDNDVKIVKHLASVYFKGIRSVNHIFEIENPDKEILCKR